MIPTTLTESMYKMKQKIQHDDHVDCYGNPIDIDDRYKGYYIAVPLSEVNMHFLPKKPFYNQKNLHDQYLLYGLRTMQYSYQPASGIVTSAYHVHLVTTQDEFESYILARDLNVDLRELFNANS